MTHDSRIETGGRRPTSDAGSDDGSESVSTGMEDINPEEEQQLARTDILAGVGVLAAALLVTGGTYLFAAPGGTYYVAWGAVIYGAIRIRRGVDRREAQRGPAPYRPRSNGPIIVFLLALGVVVVLAL